MRARVATRAGTSRLFVTARSSASSPVDSSTDPVNTKINQAKVKKPELRNTSRDDAEEYRPTNAQVAALIDHAAADLHTQFQGIFATETIHAVVADTYQQLNATARVHTHLTTLTTRYARERLTDIAKSQGATVPITPEAPGGRSRGRGRALARGGGASPRAWRSWLSTSGVAVSPGSVTASREILSSSPTFAKRSAALTVRVSEVGVLMRGHLADEQGASRIQ
ncbi:three-helix bundle dimerization domain-containing protein [Saccharopolyspora elongata]|uniref:three-helix bundle dimerization domain-containing protein n=1 Tax=Saccharopolyspora elongata TaxID=2530387 RepID=UPI002E271659